MRVEAVEVVRNELVADESGRIRAVPTDDREVIPCGLVLRSVGYRGTAMPGVPFDEGSATIRNDGGRVLDDEGAPIPGVYCTGWIKRGPSGVIGTNKKDATETVELLLEDARAGLLPGPAGGSSRRVDDVLAERGVAFVTYAGWEAIDAVERERGEREGRPRVKLCSWEQLLEAARAQSLKGIGHLVSGSAHSWSRAFLRHSPLRRDACSSQEAPSGAPTRSCR